MQLWGSLSILWGCLSSHTQKSAKFLNLRYLVLIHKNTLDIQTTHLLLQLLCKLTPPSPQAILSELLDMLFPVLEVLKIPTE